MFLLSIYRTCEGKVLMSKVIIWRQVQTTCTVPSEDSLMLLSANPSGAPEFTLVFSGVRVTRSLVLYLCFVNRCLSFCTLYSS